MDEPSFHSKLTWKDVNDIRARAAQGESQKSVGEEYGIGSALCSQIVRNRIWNPAMYVPLTCGQEMRDRIIGALETGCRQGEMQRVQNSDIDWHSREMKIAKAHTKASVARRIPFDPEGRLGEILGPRRFVGGPKGFVLGDATGALIGDFNRLWREVKLIANGVQPEYVKREDTWPLPARRSSRNSTSTGMTYDTSARRGGLKMALTFAKSKCCSGTRNST